MEGELERLRTMLGVQDVWGQPAESESPLDVNSDAKFALEIDEEFPLHGHGLKSQLKQCVGPVEGKMTAYFRIMTFTDNDFSDKQEAPDFSKYALQIGQEAPEEELFCPLVTLTKYPYTYIATVDRDRVTAEFFAKGNFYKRPWDL